MSGNNGTGTEPPSWTAATDEQVSSDQVLLMGVQPPGTGGNQGQTSLAFTFTPKQVANLVKTGVIPPGSEVTAGAVATTIPGLPSIAAAGGTCVLRGFIAAQDQVTGDTALWTIALLVKRVPNGATCLAVGDTSPSPFATEGTLANLAAPSLGANSAGPVISMTGLAGITINWDYNLNYTVSSIS